MHALPIQNLSKVLSNNFTSFSILFLAAFCYLAQLRVRVGGRWGRGRAEAEDVSRGRYARHCRLTLLSCLEPILRTSPCFVIMYCYLLLFGKDCGGLIVVSIVSSFLW